VTRLKEAVPVFLVADIAATMPWYADRLGFAVRAVPPAPPHTFCIMTRDDVTIFLQQLEGYRKSDVYERREGGVWNAYLETDDVRTLYDQLSADPAVTILEELEHKVYGQTEFAVRDPNGYVLVLAQPD
jgi:uncharacterized glyoxalase superfamily protein PhnB